MKSSKTNLLWAAYPLLLLLFVFGLISVINWDYESKLLFLDKGASDWSGMHMGPILLAAAMGLALIAGFLLGIIWAFWPEDRGNWFLVPLSVVTILLVFPGLFIVMLGPAAITMLEQTRSLSR
jgi:hypothetical protein